MTTDKRYFSLRLQPENFAKIQAIAKLEKRSLAAQIEVLVERFVAEYEKEHGQVEVQPEKNNG